MKAARSLASLVTGWIAAAAVPFGAITVWTSARGGVFHRTAVCCRASANVDAAAMLAAAIGFVPAGLWWALGAEAVGWRWARLGIVATGTVLGVIATVFGAATFIVQCMCAPG